MLNKNGPITDPWWTTECMPYTEELTSPSVAYCLWFDR